MSIVVHKNKVHLCCPNAELAQIPIQKEIVGTWNKLKALVSQCLSQFGQRLMKGKQGTENVILQIRQNECDKTRLVSRVFIVSRKALDSSLAGLRTRTLTTRDYKAYTRISEFDMNKLYRSMRAS